MSSHEHPATSWRLPAAVALTTFATLCAELDLTRLISLLFLRADAYWVIAVALLGFGIGGALVAVAGTRLVSRADALLAPLMQALGGAIALVPVGLRTLQPRLAGGFQPENALELFTATALLCLVPFLLASCFLSLVFMRHRDQIGRLYGFDLLGGALGCALFLVLLKGLGAERILAALGALVVVASFLLVPRAAAWARASGAAAALVVTASGAVLLGPSPLLPLYARELRLLHQYQGAAVQLELQEWDAVARIDIASVREARLRLPEEVPYKLLTQDGGAPSVLLGFDRPPAELEFPKRTLLGAAWWARPARSGLVIGPGGGADVVVALHHQPERLTVVELNATTIEAVAERFRDFTGGLYQHDSVRVVHDDGRHFVRTSEERFDVIQLTGVDTGTFAAGGNLAENYLYTLEAFGDYVDRLGPDGILSLTYPHSIDWGVRTVGMLLEVLRSRGVAEPPRHLVVAAGGGYVNVLAKRSPFTRPEVDAIAAHFEQPLYGHLLPAYYDLWGRHLPADQENLPFFALYTNQNGFFEQQGMLFDPYQARRNPYGVCVARWSAQPGAPALWQSLGVLPPASDDRPFFFAPIDAGAYFRSGIVALGIPALLFIVAPLLVFRGRGVQVRGAPLLGVFFAGLGFAFIALEMALLQKFVLFLGHPALSFAVVLAGLLVATGLGSLLSERWAASPQRVVVRAVAAIAGWVLLFLALAGPLTDALLRAPLPARAAATLALILPLGLAMGMLFPSGVRLLGSRAEAFVPWAWGINGSASVIGTLLSLFLALQLGFSVLMGIAVAVYVLAALAALGAALRLR